MKINAQNAEQIFDHMYLGSFVDDEVVEVIRNSYNKEGNAFVLAFEMYFLGRIRGIQAERARRRRAKANREA